MSKFSEYKLETGTTPLSAYIDTELFNIIKSLASAKKTTMTAVIADTLTAYVNANGYPQYVYPRKESLAEELARVKAELEALKNAKS